MSVTTSRRLPLTSLARLRDLGFYFVIGGLLVIAALGLAKTNLSRDALIRWGGLTVNTCVLFGYFVADSRPLLGRIYFWILTAGLLSLHTLLFAIILSHIAQWKLVWFLVMYLEAPVLVFFRNRFFHSA